MSHLSNNTIENIFRETVPMDSIIAALDHIGRCGECAIKYKLALIRTEPPHIYMPAEACPPKDAIVAYYAFADDCAGLEREYIEKHLSDCGKCQKTYADIVEELGKAIIHPKSTKANSKLKVDWASVRERMLNGVFVLEENPFKIFAFEPTPATMGSGVSEEREEARVYYCPVLENVHGFQPRLTRKYSWKEKELVIANFFLHLKEGEDPDPNLSLEVTLHRVHGKKISPVTVFLSAKKMSKSISLENVSRREAWRLEVRRRSF
jgi:hypothetical protein